MNWVICWANHSTHARSSQSRICALFTYRRCSQCTVSARGRSCRYDQWFSVKIPPAERYFRIFNNHLHHFYRRKRFHTIPSRCCRMCVYPPSPRFYFSRSFLKPEQDLKYLSSTSKHCFQIHAESASRIICFLEFCRPNRRPAQVNVKKAFSARGRQVVRHTSVPHHLQRRRLQRRKKAERTMVRSAWKNRGIYLIVSSSSPALTDWPPLTKTSSTVPSMRATTLVSIFMASITASTSLTLT